MTLKIEPVKTEELPLLVQITRSTFYDTFHEHNTKEDLDHFLDSSFNPQVLRFELAQPFNHFFFGRFGNKLAGYLQLSTAKSLELPGEVLEISRIYVEKEWIGSGVGKSFMQFAISFAKQMNKNLIFLGVWEANDNAIAFYRRFGFERFGEHVFMVGKDAQTDWLMKKDLGKKGGNVEIDFIHKEPR